MNKKYIDIEVLKQQDFQDFSNTDVFYAIDHCPAADVKEIIMGKWFDCGSLSCRCNNCGCKNDKESNYCPICGSDMRKLIKE